MIKKDNYHHGNLPAELIRLGLESIESEGMENLSLRALSDRAGVSKTAPYRHFVDRDAFLTALAEEGYRLLYETLRAAVPEEGEHSLPTMGRAYFAFALARPSLYRLMTSPILCEPANNTEDPEGSQTALPQDHGWPRRALLFLAECLARDTARRGGDPAQNPNAAAAAWAYVHGLVMLKIDRLFPLDYGEPDWDFLASISPNIPVRMNAATK